MEEDMWDVDECVEIGSGTRKLDSVCYAESVTL
jgi:hypothetical protein